MMGELKYYKSVCFDRDQEYTELGINETNQRILVNHEELALNLLYYNKKIPIEVEQITINEHFDFMVNENYSGLAWINNKLTNLTIKEVRKEENNMELKDTIEGMTSPDYKERFKAEWKQLIIREGKLKSFILKIYEASINGSEEPMHDCPLSLLEKQLDLMIELEKVLAERARLEHIDLFN